MTVFKRCEEREEHGCSAEAMCEDVEDNKTIGITCKELKRGTTEHTNLCTLFAVNKSKRYAWE